MSRLYFKYLQQNLSPCFALQKRINELCVERFETKAVMCSISFDNENVDV